MKITDIITTAAKPGLYEKGTSFMWTDEYISKQLLQIHLNPDIDLGSRKFSTIKKTANWILDSAPSEHPLHILDLGCGPGLYTELFAEKGHKVTGIDISKTSIEYAVNSAKEKGLQIEYINGSYLDIVLPKEQFDLIVLIYTDLGVLLPSEREHLLGKIHRTLKPGGLFIFDVLNDNDLAEKAAPKNWEAANGGFWESGPYLALSESHLYEEQKVILYQHLVSNDEDELKIYRFWTHFFSETDVKDMLSPHGYTKVQIDKDVLPRGDRWNGENVLFCKAIK
ncbi:class I SAM-dependent methyltransferase [Maribellus sediminis]|uniref:class I SAM-dependent methyltransferase n=1 Tax=Maribellus sediminis TaxID=2696285 RepID=UPI00142F9AA0|nr:class I SAM-dependent methyltransferase [Maribellus sediminis]